MQEANRVHPKDLHVREGRFAPITPSLMELAENDDPRALINDLFTDKWRPWIAIYCGDGRWADKVSAAIQSYNAGGTDQTSVMGSVSTLAKFIRANREEALDLFAEQVVFAHEHHNVVGIQVITHPLCGATKDQVVKRVVGAKSVYSSPTKASPEIVQLTRRLELQIHRQDLDTFRDWAFKRFPFIDAIEYLRATKSRLEPFSHHEEANCRQIEKMIERGELSRDLLN
jgi:hypothetical protein